MMGAAVSDPVCRAVRHSSTRSSLLRLSHARARVSKAERVETFPISCAIKLSESLTAACGRLC